MPKDYDYWVSFECFDGTWCPILANGDIDYSVEGCSPPDGLVAGEYDCDADRIFVDKESFSVLGAAISLHREPVESSNIVSIGYAPDIGFLDVEFTTGAVYRYFNVPRELQAALREADSHGKFLSNNIKREFAYVKLDA